MSDVLAASDTMMTRSESISRVPLWCQVIDCGAGTASYPQESCNVDPRGKYCRPPYAVVTSGATGGGESVIEMIDRRNGDKLTFHGHYN